MTAPSIAATAPRRRGPGRPPRSDTVLRLGSAFDHGARGPAPATVRASSPSTTTHRWAQDFRFPTGEAADPLAAGLSVHPRCAAAAPYPFAGRATLSG